MADGQEHLEAAAPAVRRIACVAALLILGLAAPSARAAVTQDVGVVGSEFRTGVCPNPPGSNIVKVKVGDAVRWTNCDPMAHDITWKQQPGLTDRDLAGAGQPGDSAQQFFNRSGFYDYYCSIHGAATSNNMQGRVVVESTQPTTTKATQPAPTTTAATIAPTTATTATTVAPATTTSSTTPDETTTSQSTTSTTGGDQIALESKDGGASGGLVALLLLGIGAAVAGGIYLLQRMRAENSLGG